MREDGLLTLSEEAWAKAKRRAAVIMPLASQENVTLLEAETAAKKLGVSSRLVYELIARCRSGEGLMTDLAPRTSSGGKGKTRIQADIEKIVSDVIESFYLTRQRRPVASVVREIRMRCSKMGLPAPSRNTVEARMRSLDPKRVTQSREGYDATRRLTPVLGETPIPKRPLGQVQIDHSPVDVIVVDESSRAPIGRPWLTLAIDVYTRCVVGMLLTLEAPSATSVGLCLAHTVSSKEAYLLRLGLQDVDWPMHGKPECIHTDNGPEFHSEALERGCDQHGIKQDFRPKKQPQFGGIIERVIGTAMKLSHELPGTTFSNVQQRGHYDSETKAALTMHELEQWLVLAVASYHKSFHHSLKMSPASCWIKSVQGQKIHAVRNERSFLIDFLPVVKRSIGRTGFVIDHIAYFADTLKPWIARRDTLGKFVIRRDPRDLSRVWVLDPRSNEYIELPYRSMSNPSVTLWEHRKAIEKLRQSGRADIDEAAIFRMVEKMRLIVATAEQETKRTRREKARRSHFVEPPVDGNVVALPVRRKKSNAKPFSEIEEW